MTSSYVCAAQSMPLGCTAVQKVKPLSAAPASQVGAGSSSLLMFLVQRWQHWHLGREPVDGKTSLTKKSVHLKIKSIFLEKARWPLGEHLMSVCVTQRLSCHNRGALEGEGPLAADR